MHQGELDDRQLDRLRHERAWWWAAWSTPVCHLTWLAVAVEVVVLLVRPSAGLAQVVLGTLVAAVLASLVKATAVEYLFVRRLDRSTRYSMRARDRELNRRQLYRATRNDALLGIGAFVWGMAKGFLG